VSAPRPRPQLPPDGELRWAVGVVTPSSAVRMPCPPLVLGGPPHLHLSITGTTPATSDSRDRAGQGGVGARTAAGVGSLHVPVRAGDLGQRKTEKRSRRMRRPIWRRPQHPSADRAAERHAHGSSDPPATPPGWPVSPVTGSLWVATRRHLASEPTRHPPQQHISRERNERFSATDHDGGPGGRSQPGVVSGGGDESHDEPPPREGQVATDPGRLCTQPAQLRRQPHCTTIGQTG
jgi:hypothetical protein